MITTNKPIKTVQTREFRRVDEFGPDGTWSSVPHPSGFYTLSVELEIRYQDGDVKVVGPLLNALEDVMKSVDKPGLDRREDLAPSFMAGPAPVPEGFIWHDYTKNVLKKRINGRVYAAHWIPDDDEEKER